MTALHPPLANMARRRVSVQLLLTLLALLLCPARPTSAPAPGAAPGPASSATTTSRVFTYFKPLVHLSPADQAKETQALLLWNASWLEQGWQTEVVSNEKAKEHPAFAQLLAAFFELPTVNRVEYEVACYTRWVAMSALPAAHKPACRTALTHRSCRPGGGRRRGDDRLRCAF